jgi:putative oxygen-independent coproporphyrinogen III oxidase
MDLLRVGIATKNSSRKFLERNFRFEIYASFEHASLKYLVAMLTLPPLALYIHLPWCVRKCPYCDFNSHALRGEIPEQAYVDALIADLDVDLARVEGRSLISIFIGGGTPSLFSPEAIEYLLLAVKQRLAFAENIEITLEANPGTVELQRFAGYRAAGVNRLSIGIQSFQSDKLKTLGRIHDAKEAIRAVESAHTAGFTNFNLDLMHGLPNQSLDDALYDIKTALSFAPTHLSWYQLTLEPNTLFAHDPPQLPPDENIWEMQDRCRELLAENNFVQYEISAYSRPDKHCAHNYNYWEFGDYLGIGAGAHSKITDVERQKVARFWKKKNPKDYLNANLSFVGDEQIIAKTALPFEFMLNALRLYQNIPVTLFEQRTGLSLVAIENILNKAQQKELLIWDKKFIQPTDLGKRFYNDLVAMFIA